MFQEPKQKPTLFQLSSMHWELAKDFDWNLDQKTKSRAALDKISLGQYKRITALYYNDKAEYFKFLKELNII